MWKISRPLGRGSFGFVSLAVSQPNDDESKLDLPSLVAIKSAEVFQLHSFQKGKNAISTRSYTTVPTFFVVSGASSAKRMDSLCTI